MDGVGGTVWSLIFWVIVIGIVVFVLVRGSQQRKSNAAADAKDAVIATLSIPGVSTLRLTQDELIDGYEKTVRYPVKGLVARVEEGGTVNRRMTVTRMATLGLAAAALPKRLDDRETYFTIEGPQTVIVHQIPVKKNPTFGVEARKFAAQVNRLGGAASADMASGAPEPEQANRTPDADIVKQIEQLAALRDAGHLTEDEFAAKKAELLSRM